MRREILNSLDQIKSHFYDPLGFSPVEIVQYEKEILKEEYFTIEHSEDIDRIAESLREFCQEYLYDSKHKDILEALKILEDNYQKRIDKI